MYVPLPLSFSCSWPRLLYVYWTIEVARAVGQLGQPAEGVVGVVDREAVLIDALGALALGVVGEVEELAVGIGDREQLVGGVVGQRRGAGQRAGGVERLRRQQVAVGVVGEGLAGAVGEGLPA